VKLRVCIDKLEMAFEHWISPTEADESIGGHMREFTSKD
jgi:hypothetical protein